jgi:heme exporter protein A
LAQDLWKRYRGTWALREVDLMVAPGECVCLVGPNGAGKTTLLRILATATSPSRGEVAVFGESTRTQPEAVRRRVGLFVAQSYVYGELTPVENLRFAATMYGLNPTDAELRERVARAGLAKAADARVRTFSQGMLQRLALARATLNDAQLMLLDEPYTALDASGLRLVDALIGDLRAAGRTVIMATHLVERGLEQCDRALALEAGRLVYDGSPAALPPPLAGAAAGGHT